MKKNYKAILYVVVILIVLLILGIELGLYIEKKEFNNLNSQYDTRLSEFYKNEETAKSYLDVFTITNNKRYQEVKGNLSYKLSAELQEELFSYDKYPLQDIGSVTYKITDIKGDMLNEEYTFKIEYTVYSQDFERNLISLVTISRGKIIDFTTL